jgi:uncharacterized protein (DUF885 family)
VTGSEALAALADEYWQRYLAFNPITATVLGDRRFDALLDDRSPAAVTAYRADLVRLQDRLTDLAAAGERLAGEDAITRSALEVQLASDLADIDAGIDQWTVDPLDGPQITALNMVSLQPIGSSEQARAMVDRWRAMGPWLDTYAENLRRSLAVGRVAVRSPVEKAIDELRATLERSDADLPLLSPAIVNDPTWDVAGFRDDLQAAVRDVVRPALVRYFDVLRTAIVPTARSDDRPGIGHLPDGDSAYRRLIRVHTSLELEPAAIHQIGLAEVARIDDETSQLGARLLDTSNLAAIHRRLRSDPTLHFTTADDVFDTAARSVDRARAAIPDWFGILPRADCVVTRMAEHEEKHSTIAYYRQPAGDGSRPGQYYINTSEPETRPRYEAEALAYHEAIPGHHLQIAIGQELARLPEFRRHLGPTAYFEGWGLYAERLSDEMGLYSGDLDRLGVLSFDAWRACRLVVDTGMHALGWTRQQAIDFMLEHSGLAPNNIVNEVDRYIVWPGQALAYKLGQLEILSLRAEAAERQGARFDIKRFHDAVLGHGAVSLGTLREIVSRELSSADG